MIAISKLITNPPMTGDVDMHVFQSEDFHGPLGLLCSVQLKRGCILNKKEKKEEEEKNGRI